jgi:glycerol-3-phosphate dehydrogenase
VQRDLAALADTRFDVLVVGAGIYGAAIACDASQRGLSVAVVDRGDFGGATSFNSLKTVHGGLRSLQRGSLAEMRHFIRERRALFRIAPHLVQPLRFLIPTSRSLTRSRAAMRVALALNDLVARDRNAGVDPALHLPRGRVVGFDEAARLFPGLDASEATGGATWYDGQMYNADRVVLAFVQSAARAGAVPANYVEATAFLREGDRVSGIQARDTVSGDRFDVRASVTINAAGAWAPDLANGGGLQGGRPVRALLSKAVNLVTRLPAPACAIGNVVDGRFLFCVPWRGIAMFGTLHTAWNGAPDALSVTTGEVAAFLDDLNRAFPAAQARPADVTLVHQGLLPMDGTKAGEVQLSKHSIVRDHRTEGAPGLITVVGVRYTTARQTAEEAVDSAGAVLGRALPPSRSAVTPLAGGDTGDLGRFLAGARTASRTLTPASLDRLARSYGAEYTRVVALVEADSTLARALSSSCAVTAAEVVYAAREEMAVRLSDALLRRTEAGSAAHPGAEAVQHAAAVMARECGWSEARRMDEAAAVDARYRLPPS